MTSLRFLADMKLLPETVADLRQQGWGHTPSFTGFADGYRRF